MAERDIPKWLKKAVEDLSETVEHCCTLEKDKSLPHVLQGASRWLTIAQDVLLCAKSQLDAKTLDLKSTDLYNHLCVTRNLADTLESILGTVASTPESTRLEKYGEVLEQRRVPSLEGVLMELLKSLKGLVVEKLILVTEEQDKQLADAIEDLEKLAPGIKQNGKNSFHHSGLGNMYRAVGGKQFNHKGSGDMYNAETLNITKDQK